MIRFAAAAAAVAVAVPMAGHGCLDLRSDEAAGIWTSQAGEALRLRPAEDGVEVLGLATGPLRLAAEADAACPVYRGEGARAEVRGRRVILTTSDGETILRR